MHLRDHYDWIVLGDDIGALLSASLAARNGLSVLVLPIAPTNSLKVGTAGELLDLESNYFLGLGQGGLLMRCLEHIGMTSVEGDLILSESAVPQILTREGRISLWGDRARLESDFEREFGRKFEKDSALLDALRSADAAVGSFWWKLPERLTLKAARGTPEAKRADSGKGEPRGLYTLKSLSEELNRSVGRSRKDARAWFSYRSPLAPWLREKDFAKFSTVFEGASSELVSSQSDGNQKMFELFHLLSLSKTGASFRGGTSALRDLLFRLARRNGADLPPKTSCRRIFLQNGKFAGVLPSSRGTMIGASGGILGAPLSTVQPLLTVSGRSWLRKLKASKKPMGWKISLSLVVHREAIPPGATRRMLWQEEGAPPLEIELVRFPDYGLKENKREVIFLRTLMPLTEQSLTSSYQRMVLARLVRKAAELLPFLEYHITRIYPDFRMEGSQEISGLYGFRSIEQIPACLLCYSGEGLGARSGSEGLFLSSSESFPDLGSFGSVIASLEATAWVSHRSGLSGPLEA